MNHRVPRLFTLIIFFIIMAACLAMSGWFRQYTLVYGTDMKSVIGIIAQVFLCLILGSWISALITDKIRNTLVFYFVSACIASLMMFFQKPAGDLLLPLSGNIPFIPFILMFIPLAIIACSLPIMVRYFIRSINNAGIYMSRTLFSISAAVIVSVILSIALIIPIFGIYALFPAGAISLLISASLVFWRITKRNDKALQQSYSYASGKTSRMRFRKKRIVLETAAKLTRAMLYGSVFQAFSFAAMFIIYLRIVINYSHLDPVLFYAVLLIVVFAGVSAGSFLYSVIADRPANKYLTLAILQILTGIAALLSFAIHQILAPDLFREIHESKSFADLTMRHILMSSLIAFTPSVIHGMALPLAGRLYPKRLQQIGRTFGYLSTLVLAGLLAGLIITPMLLIPLIGTQACLIILCLLVVISGVYLITRDSRLIRAFRLAFVFSALLIFILVIVVLRMFNVSHINRVSDGMFEGSTSAVHYATDSANSKLVYINNDYYFGTDKESLKEQILSACISLAIKPDLSNSLFIGFNTGITASIFEKFGVSEIRIIDVSPELIRLSSSVFSEENEDIFTESSVEVVVTDPRFHLLNRSGRYDMIYSGSEQVLLYPSRYTIDFLRICRDKLSQEGVYCFILPYNRMDTTAVLTYIKNCSQVFEHTSVWYLSEGRMMVIASRKELIPEYCKLSDVIEKLKSPWLLRISTATPEQILAHFLFSDYSFDSILLPENSDKRPQLIFRLTSFDIHRHKTINLSALAQKNTPLKIADSCNVSEGSILSKVSELNRLLMQKSSAFSDVQQHVDDSTASN